LGALTPAGDGPPEPDPPPPGNDVAVDRPTEQVHFCLGVRGYPQTDKRRYAQVLLDSAIGGGPSSRLFQEIRENRGLVYHIGSDSVAYRRSGMLSISASTAPERFDTVLDLVRREIDRVHAHGLDDGEVERAKEQTKGGIALALENTSFRMRRLAMCEIYWGRFIPFAEVVANIDSTATEEVTAIARELLDPEALVLAAIGPLSAPGEEKESLS